MIIGALVAALFIAAVAPFLREYTLKTMGSEERKDAPGQCIPLSSGTTYFEWSGPEDGPLLVCIHGLTTPCCVWHGLASRLGGMGYRILIYDLYGRGYSDRPSGRQTKDFFVRQLGELLSSQQINRKFTVFGFSMGGAIATAFAAAYPDKVQQLVLVAPAGIHIKGMNFIRGVMRLPILGDWFACGPYRWIHRKGTEAERDCPTSVPDIVDRQQKEMDFRGFGPAVLSSMRSIISEDHENSYKTIARHDIPTLLILGEQDTIIPLSVGEVLSQWHPTAQIHQISDAGHGLPYSHSDHIIKILKSFLSPSN